MTGTKEGIHWKGRMMEVGQEAAVPLLLIGRLPGVFWYIARRTQVDEIISVN